VSGNIKVEANGTALRFIRVSDGRVLLSQTSIGFGPPIDVDHEFGQVSVSLDVASYDLYGLGMQRQTCYPAGGRQTPPLGKVFAPGKVLSFELAAGEGGAANTLPWVTGTTPGKAAEFGFWLNNPSMGNVSFDATVSGKRSMVWNLAAAAHLDYIITAPSAAAIAAGTQSFALLESFTSWVGRSPGLPDYALGYWHSKNRYASQADLLKAAHGFANRSIPVDIITVDWYALSAPQACCCSLQLAPPPPSLLLLPPACCCPTSLFVHYLP
jgi:alpha-glucosidase (family GH31 glycosyl hydrolase)